MPCHPTRHQSDKEVNRDTRISYRNESAALSALGSLNCGRPRYVASAAVECVKGWFCHRQILFSFGLFHGDTYNERRKKTAAPFETAAGQTGPASQGRCNSCCEYSKSSQFGSSAISSHPSSQLSQDRQGKGWRNPLGYYGRKALGFSSLVEKRRGCYMEIPLPGPRTWKNPSQISVPAGLFSIKHHEHPRVHHR